MKTTRRDDNVVKIIRFPSQFVFRIIIIRLSLRVRIPFSISTSAVKKKKKKTRRERFFGMLLFNVTLLAYHLPNCYIIAADMHALYLRAKTRFAQLLYRFLTCDAMTKTGFRVETVAVNTRRLLSRYVRL